MRLALVVLLLVSPFLGWSQPDKALVELNDNAFAALEESDTSVVRLANQLLAESKRLNKPNIFEINAHTILGIVNKDKGFYVTSLSHYLKALNQAEKLQDTGRMSACYSNIGSVYQLQNNYQKAREYFEKSLKIEIGLNNPLQLSIRYFNLGEVYGKMDSFDLSLTYFNNSLAIEKKLKNTEGVVYALLGISEIYIKMARFVDAEILLEQVEGKLNDKHVEEQILYYHLNGRLKFEQAEYNAALEGLNRAESISKKNDFRVYLLDIYDLQIKLLKKLESWKEAVAKYDQFTSLEKELSAILVKNQLVDLTFQNELTKKDLKIELLGEEKELIEKNRRVEMLASNHKEKIVWFLLVSLLILVILIVLGIRKISNN